MITPPLMKQLKGLGFWDYNALHGLGKTLLEPHKTPSEAP